MSQRPERNRNRHGGERRHANTNVRTRAIQTQIITMNNPRPRGEEQGDRQRPILRLRRRRIRWTEDTHDNEHDGKKSSKSCCIYHKQRAWNESSSESDADDDKNHYPHDDGNNSDSSSSSGGPIVSRPVRQIPSADCYNVDTVDENRRPQEEKGYKDDHAAGPSN